MQIGAISTGVPMIGLLMEVPQTRVQLRGALPEEVPLTGVELRGVLLIRVHRQKSNYKEHN